MSKNNERPEGKPYSAQDIANMLGVSLRKAQQISKDMEDAEIRQFTKSGKRGIERFYDDADAAAIAEYAKIDLGSTQNKPPVISRGDGLTIRGYLQLSAVAKARVREVIYEELDAQ